jgi:hypothetical protein
MALNSTLDQLKIYDDCIVSAVEAFPFQPDGRAVPVILATPERPYASSDNMRDEKASQGVVFPIISVERGDLAFDEMRYRGENVKFKRNTLGYISTAKEEVNTTPFPSPVDVSYVVTLHTKTRSAMNEWKQLVLLTYGENPNWFTMDLSGVWQNWGLKRVSFESEGVSEESELDAGEDQRSLTATWAFTLKGWLFGEMETIKTVLTVQTEYEITDIE